MSAGDDLQMIPPNHGRWTVQAAARCLGLSFGLGLSLVLLFGSLLSGAQVVVNGGPVMMNNGGVITYGGTPIAPPPPLAVGDSLHFLDGSEVHGRLGAIEAGPSIVWHHPDSANDLRFTAANLDFIRFAQSTPLDLKPGCRVRFINGDELFANLRTLDLDAVQLETWFAGVTKVPRSAIQSIAFLPANFTIAYEGPVEGKEWNVNPPSTWWCRDGVFTSSGTGGALIRDCKLTGSSTIEFDLAWSGALNLIANLFSDKEQADFGGRSYFLTIGSDGVDLRRGQPGTGSLLGKAPLPLAPGVTHFHATIQYNSVEGALAFYADGQLVKRWKENVVPTFAGGHILFSDFSGRPGLRLSNFRVCQWQGVEPALVPAAQTNFDCLGFINHDKASGQVLGLNEGKLSFLLRGRTLEIPLQRITRLDFAATNAPDFSSAPQEVRAWLSGAGRLSVVLDSWAADKVSVHSALFGPLTFNPRAIRQLDFNLGRRREQPVSSNIDEFGGLDE